jgi:hypothetical protein
MYANGGGSRRMPEKPPKGITCVNERGIVVELTEREPLRVKVFATEASAAQAVFAALITRLSLRRVPSQQSLKKGISR